MLAHIPVSYEDVSLLRYVQLTCRCWNMAVKSEAIKHRWALIQSGHKFVRTELLDILFINKKCAASAQDIALESRQGPTSHNTEIAKVSIEGINTIKNAMYTYSAYPEIINHILMNLVLFLKKLKTDVFTPAGFVSEQEDSEVIVAHDIWNIEIYKRGNIDEAVINVVKLTLKRIEASVKNNHDFSIPQVAGSGIDSYKHYPNWDVIKEGISLLDELCIIENVWGEPPWKFTRKFECSRLLIRVLHVCMSPKLVDNLYYRHLASYFYVM